MVARPWHFLPWGEQPELRTMRKEITAQALALRCSFVPAHAGVDVTTRDALRSLAGKQLFDVL
eukprot:3592571-Alexandrium_andersonii.AAC.1